MARAVFFLHAPVPPEPPDAAVRRLLQALDFRPSPGEVILVKPNLVSASGAQLSCTSPAVVRAVCAGLLDLGARVRVADSPAFGNAPGVAKAAGLDRALAPLGLRVESLDRPRPLKLSFGYSIGLSAEAAEADRIVSLPRLKAHGQLRITAAVKNLFGCVCGFRKALAHTLVGDTANHFVSLLVEVLQALPPVITILDGITAMHVDGPTRGQPYPLHLLAACADPVALDTALYGLLGLRPEHVPLWAECRRRNLPGADPAGLTFPLESPAAFDVSGFQVPGALEPIVFRPMRFLRGRLKSLLG